VFGSFRAARPAAEVIVTDVKEATGNILLGIDLGGSGVKAAWLDAEGRAHPVAPGGETPGRARAGRYGLRWWKRHVGGAGGGTVPTDSQAAAVLAQHLRAVRCRAASQAGRLVGRAVVAVPPRFTTRAIHVIQQGAEAAGLEVLALPCEPVAAAARTCLDDGRDPLRVLTYDLGGTFSAAVVEKRDGALRLLAADGSWHLGGFHFDSLLTQWILYRLRGAGHALDLDLKDPRDCAFLAALDDQAERAKIVLSGRRSHTLRAAIPRGGEEVEIELRIAQEELLALIDMKIQDTILRCRRLMGAHSGGEAGQGDPDIPLSARRLEGELDELLVLGGSSRIPLVQMRLTDEYGPGLRVVADPAHHTAAGAAALADRRQAGHATCEQARMET
jgi:molecular chaperone DnaK